MVIFCHLPFLRSTKCIAYYFLHLQLLLFRSFSSSMAQLAQEEITIPMPTSHPGPPGNDDDHPIFDFGKLVLNENSLKGLTENLPLLYGYYYKAYYYKGSRWSTEYKYDIEVYHAIDIVDIARVDVDTMSIRIEFHLRQRWFVYDLILPRNLFKDADPNNSFVVAEQNVLDSVWSPDSYFPNARETKIASVSDQQSLVKIFKNKTIMFSSRISSTLGCSFAFHWYPVDSQSCELIIESYTIPSTKVIYLWEDPNVSAPVTLGIMKLLQYELRTPLKYYNDTSTRFGRTERYAQVIVRFTFERKIGQYIIQTTIPTTLVVVLSWFSFWLGLDAVPGRISLVITCMLSLVTMHNSQKKDLPPVNYVKMSDIWMVGCMAFVFVAFCEFIVVKYIQWMNQEKEKKKNEIQPFHDPPPAYPLPPQHHNLTNRRHIQEPYVQFFEKNVNNPGQPGRRIIEHSPRFNTENFWERDISASFMQEETRKSNIQRKKRTPVWITIDMISRVAFPFFFAMFCAVYWPLLLMGADADVKAQL